MEPDVSASGGSAPLISYRGLMVTTPPFQFSPVVLWDDGSDGDQSPALSAMYAVALQGAKERGKAWNTQVVFVNSGDGSRGFHPPKKDPGAVWLAFVGAHNEKAATRVA